MDESVPAGVGGSGGEWLILSARIGTEVGSSELAVRSADGAHEVSSEFTTLNPIVLLPYSVGVSVCVLVSSFGDE